MKYLLLLLFCFINCHSKQPDLTVVGKVLNADGLCRIPITLIDLLKDDCKINHIQPFNEPIDILDIKEAVREVLFNPDKTPGSVSLLVEPVGTDQHPTYSCVPESKIKIAYSMFESDKIPPFWVEVFNQYFDAILVPDSSLIEIYTNSGVEIPIFELPLYLRLEEFLAKKTQPKPNSPFVFGCPASGLQHKNQIMLIQAFAEEFGNDPDVLLRLTSRWISDDTLNLWKQLIKSYNCTNIEIKVGIMDNNIYLENMASLDCYVNISKGEGFSIGPREALALGIPCILTNNTAQKTICKSGLVRLVESELPESPSTDYAYLGNVHEFGHFLNCNLEDVKEALQDVYQYYDLYLEKAKQGPEWVSQYYSNNLKARYLNAIKPKKVILGDKNEITNEYLMTSSKELYEKYKNIASQKLFY